MTALDRIRGCSPTRISRRHPVVARIVRSWRELTNGRDGGRGGRDRTGDRRTLLACSGGADSSALVLALATGLPGPSSLLVVAHVVHDLRPADQALPDRDAARALAESLGLRFVESAVRVRGDTEGRNAEAAARRLRYAALVRLAADAGCRFLATAHQSDDQLETVLMALARGSGPAGLSGIAPSRAVAGATLIRPMLGVTRADAERLCLDAGRTWREDATNLDTSRLRAAIRHTVLPALRRIRPRVAAHAGEAASLVADAADLIRRRAGDLTPDPAGTETEFAWPRRVLRDEPAVVVGEALRLAAARLLGGRRRDRLGLKRLRPAIRVIRNATTDPKRFVWSGLELDVTVRRVALRRRAAC